MDWRNLLPSCIDCNRRRRQILVTEGMSLEEAEKQRISRQGERSTGKKNAFPIIGRRCTPEEKSFNQERALLIDPTRDRPEHHLAFTVDGLSLVLAAQRGGSLDAKGRASIEVYGLNRLGLVQERTRLLNTLSYLKSIVLDCLDMATRAASPGDRDRLLDRALKTMRDLKTYADPSAPYAAVATAFLKRLADDLERDSGKVDGEPAVAT